MGFEEYIRRTNNGGFLYKTIYVRKRYIILNKLGNKRTDWLAAASPGNIAVGEEVADDNWDMFVHSQADGGFVHDGDVWVGQNIVVRYMVEFDGVREFRRIFIVNTVNFRCFNDNIALHF